MIINKETKTLNFNFKTVCMLLQIIYIKICLSLVGTQKNELPKVFKRMKLTYIRFQFFVTHIIALL